MMLQFLRFRAIFVVAIKRLLAQPLLTIATTLGLTIAVALVMTIPIYTESVAFRILTERLIEQANDTNRPPFSYMFSYIGSWNEPINLEDTTQLDAFVKERGGDELGLNTSFVVRHLETRNVRLYPASEANYSNEDLSLDYVSFGTTENIENHIELLEGRLPILTDTSPDSVVEVMIHEDFATRFGIQAGEDFVGFNWRLEVSDPLQLTPVRVVGIWRPLDVNSPYWFYKPGVFEDILLIPPDTFEARISPYTEEEVYLGIWYLVTDGTGVNTSRVDELIVRNDETERIADQLLPGTYIQASPVRELKPYQRIVTVLTLTLTVFSIPIVALLLIFLIMIMNLVVDGQRNETAILRSRGTTPFQIIGLTIVESLITGIIALILGFGIAVVFTQLLGSTRSFLEFSYDSHFIVSIPQSIVPTISLALLVSIAIRVIPTITASRHTIISYKLNSARLLRRPLWQRLGIDILLLILIAYSYYQIVQQGGLINIEGGISDIEQAYEQPFVFLLPPLSIFALSLFVLRFLPFVMRLLVGIIQLTDSVGLLIVTRQLERSPRTYYLPLILLISTLSLGIYTASFARTIDRYLFEQQYYRVAADLSIRVFSVSSSGVPGGGTDDSDQAFMHISEFTSIPKVQSATRFGEYQVRADLTSGNQNGKIIGIDRAELGETFFWRPDFASIRLGYLLNNLGTQQDTVLVSREFLEENSLEIGDFLDLDVLLRGETVNLALQIVGVIDYFPRWFPEDDGALFVTNLDYLFEQAQTELPHRILLRVSPDFDEREFRREILLRGASSISIEEPVTRIEREQSRPERQGLFGLLSIGFIASSVMTMIGFLLYAVFSYQRRYVELGILRAIGLSQSAMMFAVAWELGLLIVVGLLAGLGIGVAVTWLYVPYMQFVSSISGLITPPYLVTIAWTEISQIIGVFIFTFLVIMLILIVILGRMRIFQAVKLGEAL